MASCKFFSFSIECFSLGNNDTKRNVDVIWHERARARLQLGFLQPGNANACKWHVLLIKNVHYVYYIYNIHVLGTNSDDMCTPKISSQHCPVGLGVWTALYINCKSLKTTQQVQYKTCTGKSMFDVLKKYIDEPKYVHLYWPHFNHFYSAHSPSIQVDACSHNLQCPRARLQCGFPQPLNQPKCKWHALSIMTCQFLWKSCWKYWNQTWIMDFRCRPTEWVQ